MRSHGRGRAEAVRALAADVPQGSVLKIDGSLAFFVTEGDVDPSGDQTQQSVARAAAKALTQAIDEIHEAHSGPSGPLPRAEVISALHAEVLDAFNEHGVQIMSPHYMTDPPLVKVVPPAKWYAAPAEPPR